MEVLTQPAFPEAEVKREVQKTLASIQAAEDQPDDVAEKAFQETSSSAALPPSGRGDEEVSPLVTGKRWSVFISNTTTPTFPFWRLPEYIKPGRGQKPPRAELEKWAKGNDTRRARPNVFARTPRR